MSESRATDSATSEIESTARTTRAPFTADDPRYRFPNTISAEAARGFSVLYAHYSTPPPIPRTPSEWDEQRAAIEKVALQLAPPSEELSTTCLGGVSVIRVRASSLHSDGPQLIYTHGGAHTYLSARSTLTAAKLMAEATGYEVISVDYTVAPRGTWQTQTAEVIAVYEALLAEGHIPPQVGMFGDSAGGGLAAGSILRMRDQGLQLPGALVLLGPWSDVTGRGDSYTTLAPFDAMLTYGDLKVCADAYAHGDEQRHPYVSPVYGDYSKPFPPTLIQGGTRELLLSDFVRHYQAIRTGGGEAILDLYEGMVHAYHILAPDAPETRLSLERAAEFFRSRLVGN